VDNRSVIFLEVMAAIAIVGVLAFLIFLVGRAVAQSRGTSAGGLSGRWYQYLLAALLLLVVIVLGIWQFSTDGLLGQAADWRADSRAITFFVIMLVVAGLGLVGFVIYLITQSAAQGAAAPPPTGFTTEPGAPSSETVPVTEAETRPASAGVRLLGLLALFVAFLLLNWIYLAKAEQLFLVQNLIYPAALAVALVLLFDKAARGWNVKSGAENFREWLLCDTVIFLLILGFLNLRQYGGGENGEAYSVMFWDMLYVALFFLIFWILDRTLTRFRFLAAHAYLIGLPILLLIWRAVQGVAMPAELSWWSGIWPFFFLAIIAFVLEIIVILLQGGENKHGLGAIKDAIYVAIYGILLIIAVPEAAA
jgi:hypothetical protein